MLCIEPRCGIAQSHSLLGACSCGVSQRAQCLCKQLAAPPEAARGRIAWLGSVAEEEDASTILRLFESYSGCISADPTSVIIRRNRWTTPEGLKHGFALVEFAKEEDATAVIECWKDPGRPLRPHRWEHAAPAMSRSPAIAPATAMESARRVLAHPAEAEGMPPLEAQLEPLTETQLRARLHFFGQPCTHEAEAKAMASGGRLAKKMYLKSELASLYRSGAALRTLRRVAGTLIPPLLLETICAQLEAARWPRSNSRRGVVAERYLVLGRATPEAAARPLAPEHVALWEAAERLLEAMVGPTYRATSLAITKNFQGSPHVDARDVTWQYAASFGDFCSGGELCIESEHPGGAEVVVLDTHNRLAKVDGRFPHWVSECEKGSRRYSVIWYQVEGQRSEPVRATYESLEET